MFTTRQKLWILKACGIPVVHFYRNLNDCAQVYCSRRGIRWCLDLEDAIDLTIFLRGNFDPEAIRFYSKNLIPGQIVLDIGANVGSHTLPIASIVGREGSIIACEPSRRAFAKLTQNISLNGELAARISAHQVLLTDRYERPLPQKVFAEWRLSTPTDAHHYHAGIPNDTVGAKVDTVDNLVSELKLSWIDVVKLDVDGAELQVLKGAQNVIDRFKPTFILEVAAYAASELGNDPYDTFEILENHGYRFQDFRGRTRNIRSCIARTLKGGHSLNIVAVHPDRIRHLPRSRWSGCIQRSSGTVLRTPVDTDPGGEDNLSNEQRSNLRRF